MEAPIDVDSDFSSEDDESFNFMDEDFNDEVDINIHFHCEHCIKISTCTEKSKPGWCCDIMNCSYGCGMKFHTCKLEEHELLCSHRKVPCINIEYGCPFILQRKDISNHLPVCPASVVICSAEWNRWSLGARERERTSIGKGMTALFSASDLDMAFALRDQKLVNELNDYRKEAREALCNGITKRFPSLPLSLHGSFKGDPKAFSNYKCRSPSHSTTDEDEETLAPGLSYSVCTELLKGANTEHKCDCEGDTGPHTSVSIIKASPKLIERNKLILSRPPGESPSDDISARCCSHGIMRSLCNFCRNDPEEPNLKFGKVWRPKISPNNPGKIQWVKESRVEKIRKKGPLGVLSFQKVDSDDEEEELNHAMANKNALQCRRCSTPPPAPLTSLGLNLEMPLKRLSRHHVKAKSMFTFLCMQELRRDEFCNHYDNVHNQIQEWLDGYMVARCPLYSTGCPYSITRLNPGVMPSEVVYSDHLQAFGIKLSMDNITDSLLTDKEKASILLLPVEILQHIISFLDGFSINNLSMTCKLFQNICYDLLQKKGLVIPTWTRVYDGPKVHWEQGKNLWFFSKSFKHISKWQFKDHNPIANHLKECPFNDRELAQEKFCYGPVSNQEIIKADNFNVSLGLVICSRISTALEILQRQSTWLELKLLVIGVFRCKVRGYNICKESILVAFRSAFIPERIYIRNHVFPVIPCRENIRFCLGCRSYGYVNVDEKALLYCIFCSPFTLYSRLSKNRGTISLEESVVERLWRRYYNNVRRMHHAKDGALHLKLTKEIKASMK